MKRVAALLTLFFVSSVALAGDQDGHGPIPPVPSEDPADPLRAWTPNHTDGVSVSLLGEYVDEPVNMYVGPAGGKLRVVPQLDNVVLGNLGLSAGFAGRFAIETTLPLVFSASGVAGSGNPTIGDLQFAAPIRLSDGFGVVPFLHLATGDQSRFLGDLGPGAGGMLTASLQPGSWVFAGNLGLDVRAPTYGEATTGGAQVRTAVTAGYLPTERLGIHFETVAGVGLLKDVNGRQIPVEGLLSVRGNSFVNWFWSAGAGTAFTGSFPAARLRVFAGIGAHFGVEKELDPIVVVDDETPPEDEVPVAEPILVVVRVADVRGNPLSAKVSSGQSTATGVRGQYTLALPVGSHAVTVVAADFGEQVRTVVVEPERQAAIEVEATLLGAGGNEEVTVNLADLDGAPVDGGQILVDGLPVGTTSTGGDVRISGLATGDHQVAVRAHGYRSVTEESSGGALPLTLLPVEGSLRVVVSDGSVPVPDAFVSFDGSSHRPAVALGGGGERVFVLSPGSWEAVVTSEAHGMQSRTIVLEEDAYTVAEAHFLLQDLEDGDADLSVLVADPTGVPIADALVTVDGLPYGATSTGGALTLHDLVVGERILGVLADDTIAMEPRKLVLYPGLQEEIFSLDWLPGSVRIRVRSPDGPIADAVVMPAGPSEMARLALGPSGAGIRQFAPGDWELLVSSAEWGTQVRHITVSEEPGPLVDVDVVLFSAESSAGLSNLRVAVTDPASIPVPGASVRLDDVDHGGTATGGILDVSGLVPGKRRLEVIAPALGDTRQDVVLKAGDQTVDVELGWGVGAVRVTATSPSGPVIDGVLRVVGDGASTRPLGLDLEGRRIVSLEPGSWQAVVVSESWGIATATFDVPQTSDRTEVAIEMSGGGGDVLLVVRDPRGEPVTDVEVDCACNPTAAVGGFVYLSGLEGEAIVAEVSAPYFVTASIEVPVGAVERIVELAPVLTPLQVSAADVDGGALAAEIRFEGPYRLPAASLDATGSAVFSLAPGEWTITGLAAEYGAQRRTVVVSPGSEDLAVKLTFSTGNVRVTADEVVIEESVHFDVGKAVLRAESDAILQEVADTLIAYPRIVSVEIGGHTDSVGDVAFNQRLSEERAAAVRAALIDRGVAPSRLSDRGYGPTRPVASNDDEESRQRNRRVQFDIQEVSEGE